MNLALRGIEADLGNTAADTFTNDLHPSLEADYILANPPFNQSAWGTQDLQDDRRWEFGIPPAGNANYAWVQHFISHLSPTGTAGFVLSNGALSIRQSQESDIRTRIIEADLVQCVVSLPGQLFYNTQIPVSLWLLTKDKTGVGAAPTSGKTLFIDARSLGTLVDRTHLELSDDDIAVVAGTYHRWRGVNTTQPYEDVPGFAKTASLDEIRSHKYALVPGRYVGFAQGPETNWDRAALLEQVSQLRANMSSVNTDSELALRILEEISNV